MNGTRDNTARFAMAAALVGMVLTMLLSSALIAAESAEKLEKRTHQMEITSPAFDSGQSIPAQYTCDGSDRLPPLVIHRVPPDTKSLALVVDDPDAPRLFTHLLAWNIRPKEMIYIQTGELPPSTLGSNDAGKRGYSGPCPPRDSTKPRHRYFFKVYALNTLLRLPEGSKRADFDRMIEEGKLIEQATLLGYYQRTPQTEKK